jgi:hypothetical protein
MWVLADGHKVTPGTTHHRKAAQGIGLRKWSKEMMVKFLLWCILLVLCWPLALLALVLYPIVWLLLLPFRVVGIAVDGVFDLLRAILFLPGRILRGPRSA